MAFHPVLGTLERTMLIWEPSTKLTRYVLDSEIPEGAIIVSDGAIVKVNGDVVVLVDDGVYIHKELCEYCSLDCENVELPTPEELDKVQKLIKLVEEAKQMLRTAYEGGINPYSALKREDWMPSSC